MKKLVATSLILSIIACIAISVVVVYIICGAGDFDISIGEVEIGVIVALLAIIVTIILGWQIYTAIDIKEKIAAIDELQQKQNSQEHRMEQMYYSTCRVIGCAMSAYGQGKDSIHPFRWLLSALAASLKMDKPADVEKLLADLHDQVKLIKSNTIIAESYINEINDFNKTIRESAHYPCFASTYDAIHREYEQKVKAEQK